MKPKDKKTGRPIANNVDYFPHKCKDDKELMFIQHKYQSQGYEVFYRLQQSLGDAEFHRIDLKNDLEKQIFEMGMSVNQEVLYGVIDILVEMNWLDKEVYEKDKVLWSDKFVNSIRAVYINRKKPTPTKEDIYRDSTGRNESIVEYSIEKNSIEKKRIESKEDDTLLSFDDYIKDYPDKDVNKSLSKYLTFADNPSDKGARAWLDREKNGAPKKFRNNKVGGFVAYCSKCGKKKYPNDTFQLNQGSSCCRVEYLPERPE
tara:strand:- start:2401 stop:3177 length:777 start_codon:yes stop_codon:yes gene_type:complete